MSLPGNSSTSPVGLGADHAVTVDVSAAVPPYEQLRAQIAGHVSAGRLAEGDRLPSVRALAADLGLAAGTVDRAYRELEATGLVSRRRRTGTVVTVPRSRADEVEPAGQLGAAVRHARRCGMADAAIMDAVQAALQT